MSLIINNEVKNKQSRGQQPLQEMIIKTEAVEDHKFDYDSLLASPKLKCEHEHSSCDPSCELNNLENISCPVIKEPADLGAEAIRQVQGAENLPLKEEEIDIQDHKPEWELIKGSTSHVGMLKDGLDRCESVRENESRASERTREEQAKYNCAHCLLKTNNRSYFVKHYKFKHSPEAEVYKCAECSHETRYKTALTRHYKCKHSPAKALVYKCAECSFETRYKSALVQHYKCKHSPAEALVYKCAECSFETRYKHGLIKHYNCKHSPEALVYKCEECSFETRHKVSLTDHYKYKHSKEAEVYKCQECLFETKYKGNLTKHYKHIH